MNEQPVRRPGPQSEDAPIRQGQGRLWGGEYASERAERRRRQLIETAFDMLATHGWREVSVEGLCARTRFNKRYFYETFANLEALASAVVDDLGSALLSDMRDATIAAEGLPAIEYATTVFGALIRNLTDDPRRARVLFGGLAATPDLEHHRAAVIKSITEALVHYGVRYHRLDRSASAVLAGALLVGGLGESIVQWLDGQIALSRDQLIAEYASLAVLVGDGWAEHTRGAARP